MFAKPCYYHNSDGKLIEGTWLKMSNGTVLLCKEGPERFFLFGFLNKPIMRIRLNIENPNATQYCLVRLGNGVINTISGPITVALALVLLPVCIVADIADAIRKR